MKNFTFKFILSSLLLSSICMNSQEFTVQSNLENLSIEVGEIFEPITDILDKNGRFLKRNENFVKITEKEMHFIEETHLHR